LHTSWCAFFPPPSKSKHRGGGKEGGEREKEKETKGTRVGVSRRRAEPFSVSMFLSINSGEKGKKRGGRGKKRGKRRYVEQENSGQRLGELPFYLRLSRPVRENYP